MKTTSTYTDMTRRKFLGATALGALAAPLVSASPTFGATDMPTRILGKTGARVSILGVGGYHAAVPKQVSDTVRLVRTAVDEGITFFDNSWDYHEGRAEEWMGEGLQDGYREKVFLMTKVCARDAKGAMAQIEQSLRRLRTDVIDLIQFHECNYDNVPEMIFAPDGAIHAAIKAREQGKVRFIGFTGHKSPHIHLKMFSQDFSWDTVQMPLNVMDATYRSFARQVVPVANARGIGVIGMKSLGGGNGSIPNSGLVTVEECLQYVLGLDISVLVSGMTNLENLRANIAVAKGFQPLNDADRRAILARVEAVAGDGRYELFKSTQRFDSGTHRAQHGFSLGG